MTEADFPALAIALRQLVGADVAVALRDVAEAPFPLWPEEAAAMARAVPARLAEFAGGRAAARDALHRLGLPTCAIPPGADRAPVWPKGVVGSIAHSGAVCGAILARSGAVLGLGLDIEPEQALDPDLWAEFCTLADLARLHELPENQRGLTARLIFCAKESTYKALYPLSGQVLGFEAMDVTIHPAQGGFVARLNRTIGLWPEGTGLNGRLALSGGYVLAVMELR